MKTAKKLTALLFVVLLIFSMSMTAFATTGAVSVKFYIPEVDEITIPTGYTYAGIDLDSVGWYYFGNTVDLSDINGCPVAVPENFSGQTFPGPGYVDTVFDVLYNSAVTKKHETVGTDFVYGFDMANTPNGIYIDKLSGISTITISSTYDPATGHGSWAGYAWNLYAVPSGATFNALSHDATYRTTLYANNIAAVSGYTYYMIFEYGSMTF
jgi:hypothetical protein